MVPMRRNWIAPILLGGAVLLAACTDPNEQVEEAVKDINIIDNANLNNLMLTASDPDEAVNYFKRAVASNPERIDLLRGLAQSQVRAGNYREAVNVWEVVIAHPQTETADSVDFADALIRQGDWKRAEEVLDGIPPTHETFKRYRLEAMIADGNKEWSKADSFYETAVGLTTTPSGALNNWGYSKLTRGDYAEAEKLFGEALKYDPGMFTAKNNFVMARGLQRNYTLPVVSMTQTERAMLLDTLARAAVKLGDVETAKTLFKQAIDTHPQHFDAAVSSLRALEQG